MDGTPNMADLFGRMAEMQQKMADTQARLADERVSAEAGGGMVRVTADGAGRILEIKLDPEVVDASDVGLLEDLVVAGVNKALEASEAKRAESVQAAATSFLPPGLDLGGMGM